MDLVGFPILCAAITSLQAVDFYIISGLLCVHKQTTNEYKFMYRIISFSWYAIAIAAVASYGLKSSASGPAI